MDWLSTVIGAGIGFIASIGTILAQRWIDNTGKLKLYCKTVGGPSQLDSVCIIKSQHESGKLTFIFPVWLEILNTSNTPRVIRDVSMWLYSNGKPVIEMIHVQMTTHTKTTPGMPPEKSQIDYGGDKNMYSFVISPRSIQREHCSFIAKINEKEAEKYVYDSAYLSYFDERDRKHTFLVRMLEKPWIPAKMRGDDKWILLKKTNNPPRR